MIIKQLSMDCFKAMVDFKMDFGQITIIAGNNSAGKTTISKHLIFYAMPVYMILIDTFQITIFEQMIFSQS